MIKNGVIGILFASTLIFAALWYRANQQLMLSPVLNNPAAHDTTLNKYTFQNLRKEKFEPTQITLGKTLQTTDTFESRMFYYTLNGKKISGWINIPKKSEPVPLIVQIRGFVPVETYTTGTGTQHSGEVYAKNGYITLAPDFLGYGESDKSSPDALEDRFLTYTTVLQLLASLQTLNSALQNDNYKVSANMQKIGLWGHSNGGHIALSILEITSGKYPTVLWAPVSKPFPYSVLYFTDEFDDHGQGLRKVIAGFEQNYNIQNYSFDNFYDWIDAPIQFNQGTADEEVPQRWTDQIVNELKTRKKDITYITYPGEDHNFSKGTWSKLVDNSLNFFKSEFAK